VTTDSPIPLATSADFAEFGTFSKLVRDFDSPATTRLMIRASRSIETKCDRRLMPFTITESTRADGVDTQAVETNGWPLDLIAALGTSEAKAFGASSLVRDCWLNEYAPLFPDMWAYSNVSVVLARAYGDTESVLGASLEGPEPDTGHFRFRLGTFVPVGTTVRVTYSGGYQTVPDDLNQATLFMAAKIAIITAEPQLRKGMTLDELDTQILELVAPFMRV
jgi:hypothetical protein